MKTRMKGTKAENEEYLSRLYERKANCEEGIKEIRARLGLPAEDGERVEGIVSNIVVDLARFITVIVEPSDEQCAIFDELGAGDDIMLLLHPTTPDGDQNAD